MIFRASWLTLGMFSAALAGGATPPQTPPILTGFSFFLEAFVRILFSALSSAGSWILGFVLGKFLDFLGKIG